MKHGNLRTSGMAYLDLFVPTSNVFVQGRLSKLQMLTGIWLI